jgi:hypothetical protein
VAEAGLVLICCYGLIGAGVGAAASATLIGLVTGLGVGLLAVAAILLVSGASAMSRELARLPVGTERRPGVPLQVRRSPAREPHG